MGTPFIGEIRMFAGSFAPQGWLLCQGQLLQISQYDVVFALIGVTYGGDGSQTFALPNLSSRVPVGIGPSPGGQNYQLGAVGGTETVTIMTGQMPSHGHPVNVAAGAGTTGTPGAGTVLSSVGPDGATQAVYHAVDTATSVPLAAGAIGPAGQNVAHTNIQPYLAVNFIICTDGIFPPRP